MLVGKKKAMNTKIRPGNKGGRFSLYAVVLLLTVTLSVASENCSVKQEFIQVFFPNDEVITAELAVTDDQRIMGLMYRDHLASDQGMLFVFEEEGIHSMWMANMLIPLDLLWLDEDKRIIHIEMDVPPCEKPPCPSYASRIPAKYVLELKAGIVEGNGLELFDRLDFILPENR